MGLVLKAGILSLLSHSGGQSKLQREPQVKKKDDHFANSKVTWEGT
jgi:hypothetical protein